MSRKIKNIKHKESIRRKINAEKIADHIGLNLNDQLQAVGFIFDHLSMSHLTYSSINSINRICRKHVGIDIHIFSHHVTQSCVIPLCPIFGAHELIRWHDYPLVPTSMATALEALSSNTSKIYYYAFDIEFIDNYNYSSSYIQKIFCNPRIKIITRHQSHKELIEEEFNTKVCDIIVENCDMEKLIKFILTENQDDRKT